jgi:hypothetical protein
LKSIIISKEEGRGTGWAATNPSSLSLRYDPMGATAAISRSVVYCDYK